MSAAIPLYYVECKKKLSKCYWSATIATGDPFPDAGLQTVTQSSIDAVVDETLGNKVIVVDTEDFVGTRRDRPFMLMVIC